MNRIVSLLFLFGLVTTVNAQNPRTHAFEREILAFEATDKTNPPPQHAILFTGSSTIRKWKSLAQDFPDHKVINRGFGGSQISDLNFFFDRVVLPYHPKVIVVYSGSNDINAHKTPATVVNNWKTFVRRVEKTLPGTKIAYISINTSGSRYKDIKSVREANKAIAAFMAAKPDRAFIDTFPTMLDADGKPRPELYLKDRLHPSAEGYALMQHLIAPYLAQVDQ